MLDPFETEKMVAPISQVPASFEEVRATLAPLAVRPFEPSMAARWDRFVREHPQASFFHQTGWKRVIEKTFGYEPCYYFAERNGEITGIAPFFSISNWIVGQTLLSVPLAVYGGICAADSESEQALLRHFTELGAAEQVDYIELRNRNGGGLPGFHSNTLYATFTAPLSKDSEAGLKRLPKDTRYMLRKAGKAGLTFRRGPELLDDFYSLFAVSMHRHGTPVMPQALFQNLLQEFPAETDVLIAYAGAQPIAGVVSFLYRDTILPYYAGARPEAAGLAANSLLYWELMKWAGEAGFRWFDFGRSKKGTGSYTFKTQWNMKVEQLDYQILLVRRKEVPNFSPLNPKFELAARFWRRLPLAVTTWLGPRVVKWFP